MKKAFVNEWIELIRPLFPSDARIKPDESNAVVFRIDWKLGNAPDRPNKRSRLIRVVISEEAIDDCNDFGIAGKKLKEVIKERIASFNPEHDQPRDAGPPVEDWMISTLDIN